MLPSVIWSCSQGVSGSALQSGHTAERQKFVLCMQVYRVGRMEADSGRCTSDQMLCHAHRTPQRWAWRADHTPRAYKPQHQKPPSGLPCRRAPWSDFLVCTCIQIQLSSYNFYQNVTLLAVYHITLSMVQSYYITLTHSQNRGNEQ